MPKVVQFIRRSENLHIVLWLIKDSCWMLEIKWLGMLMIFPAVTLAILITYYSRAFTTFYINLAVFFWIVANSFWMIEEFYFEDAHKYYAAIPFALGFVCVGVYYFRKLVVFNKTSNTK